MTGRCRSRERTPTLQRACLAFNSRVVNASRHGFRPFTSISAQKHGQAGCCRTARASQVSQKGRKEAKTEQKPNPEQQVIPFMSPLLPHTITWSPGKQQQVPQANGFLLALHLCCHRHPISSQAEVSNWVRKCKADTHLRASRRGGGVRTFPSCSVVPRLAKEPAQTVSADRISSCTTCPALDSEEGSTDFAKSFSVLFSTNQRLNEIQAGSD